MAVNNVRIDFAMDLPESSVRAYFCLFFTPVRLWLPVYNKDKCIVAITGLAIGYRDLVWKTRRDKDTCCNGLGSYALRARTNTCPQSEMPIIFGRKTTAKNVRIFSTD